MLLNCYGTYWTDELFTTNLPAVSVHQIKIWSSTYEFDPAPTIITFINLNRNLLEI